MKIISDTVTEWNLIFYDKYYLWLCFNLEDITKVIFFPSNSFSKKGLLIYYGEKCTSVKKVSSHE